MKKYLLLTVAFLAIGCTNETKEMKETAYEYSMAMANYTYDEAIPYATEETASTTIAYVKMLKTQIDTAYIISDTPAKIDITGVKKTSDTTGYALYHKTTPIKDFSDTLQLIKREGKWLAHAPITRTRPKNTEQTFKVTDSVFIDGQYRPLISRIKQLPGHEQR